MFNPKSLENLRKPKQKKSDRGYRNSLPQEKIDELFTYLSDGLPLKRAAQRTKICFETARKYFREGDQKRGIKPLYYRLTVFQDKMSEKMNVLLEERRIKMVEVIRKAIDLFSEQIQQGSLLNKPNINHLDKLMRLEVFLMGGLMQKEHEKKFLTAEEISREDPQGEIKEGNPQGEITGGNS